MRSVKKSCFRTSRESVSEAWSGSSSESTPPTTHADKGQARRQRLPNSLPVLGIVARMIRRFAEGVENGLVLWRESVPCLLQPGDGGRAEGRKHGKQGVVIAELQQVLQGED